MTSDPFIERTSQRPLRDPWATAHLRVRRVRQQLLAGVLAAAAPCALSQAGGFSFVQLERTQCYGTCPVYTVRIAADGSVTYDGRMHVAERGERFAKVDPEAVGFLSVALRLAQFEGLRERYAEQADGCESIVTDLPAVKITVDSPSVRKSVYYYFGCSGPKQARQIAWLAESIDRAAQVEQWVRPR